MSKFSTRLYKPGLGIAVGAVASALERQVRRRTMKDDRYTYEYAYAISIHNAFFSFEKGTEILGSRAFVFPVGPSEMTVRRVFRQTVTPTIGGVVAEESGQAYRDIEIAGSFGLQAKYGWDGSLSANQSASPIFTGPFSGPEWTLRLLRNFFDGYAKAKSNPESAGTTYMVWHNFKDDEHYRVVPQQVTLNRSVASRGQYPFRLTFRAIADDDPVFLPFLGLTGLLGAIAKVKGAISKINNALQIVASSVQSASNLLGEVRGFVATIDSIVDKLTTIAGALDDFIDGAKRTAEMGAMFMQSVAALLDEALDVMESADALPASVTQTYREASDALDSAIQGVKSFRDEEPSEAKDEYDRNANQGQYARPVTGDTTVTGSDAAVAASGGRSTARAFTAYGGSRRYVLTGADTLTSVAARMLGDGSRWYELAVLNGLSAPYLSPVGGPGILRPGDVLLIPTKKANPGTGLTGGDDAAALLGVDIRLRETGLSQPGRAQVDIELDSTNRDVRTIAGTDNLGQALQLRTWTAGGSFPFAPAYGMPQAIGLGSDQQVYTLLTMAVRTMLKADARVQRVSDFSAQLDGDVVMFDANILPIGYDSVVSVSASVQ